MIRVDIGTTGELILRCTLCEAMETVPLEDIKCIFGDIHVGYAVLAMVGHYDEKHDRIPASDYPVS